MSENRKILVAKRKNDRNNKSSYESSVNKERNNFNKGVKRAISETPKKNFANDRLKKLRTSLNEDAQKCLNQPMKYVNTKNKYIPKTEVNTSRNARKRLPEPPDISPTKVSKNCKLLNKNSSLSSQEEKTAGKRSIFVFNSPSENIFPAATTSTDMEFMEWSPADDVQSAFTTTTALSTVSKENNENKNYIYIVVDTNIFISRMQIIRDIVEMDVKGNRKPVVFIPWMVIEELDFIKEDSSKNSLKWKAQDAIKYIEKTLNNKDQRMLGQTLEEVNDQKDTGRSQDNKIISCCLQVLEKYHNMILLTDDINLRNKAHINSIPVCSHKEILTKISISTDICSKSEIILNKMTSLCATVIHKCALKAYGNACNKMPICQKTPKSIQDCINIFMKYWFPVFQEVLMKQFKKSIGDLSTFLANKQTIKDNSTELNDLLRLCVRVCIFLKDVDCCKSLVESTIREMNTVKET